MKESLYIFLFLLLQENKTKKKMIYPSNQQVADKVIYFLRISFMKLIKASGDKVLYDFLSKLSRKFVEKYLTAYINNKFAPRGN